MAELVLHKKIRFPSPVRKTDSSLYEKNRSHFYSIHKQEQCFAIKLGRARADQPTFKEICKPEIIKPVVIRPQTTSDGFKVPQKIKVDFSQSKQVSTYDRSQFYQAEPLAKLNNKQADKVFSYLLGVITKIFLREKLREKDLGREYYKYNLIRQFYIKKYKGIEIKKANTFNYGLPLKQAALNVMNGCLTLNSSKRVEENNKLIFKNVLKDLKVKFKEKRGLPDVAKTDKMFYEYYFEETSDRTGISLACFYDPLYNYRLKNPIFKTYSHKYFKLIFNDNEQFEKDFRESLRGLMSRYRSTIPIMLKTILFPIYETMYRRPSKSEEEAIYSRLTKTLIKKTALKLPWTLTEIKSAVLQFEGIINSCSP